MVNYTLPSLQLCFFLVIITLYKSYHFIFSTIYIYGHNFNQERNNIYRSCINNKCEGFPFYRNFEQNLVSVLFIVQNYIVYQISHYCFKVYPM